MGDGEVFEVDRAVLALVQADLRLAFHDGADIERFQSLLQLIDARDRGEPFGQPDEIVDEPDQGRLHRAEGRDHLHHGAERHFAGEIFRRDQQERHDREQRAIGVEDEGDDALLANDAEPGCEDAAVILADRQALVGIAADQRDAFGVLAQPGHLRPELRLRLVLCGDPSDQRPAGEIGGQRGDDRVDDRGEAPCSWE